jgi:hypothetical protein
MEATDEFARESGERSMAPIPLKPGRRERELAELLIHYPELREGIYPPELPPCPANDEAPASGNYPAPVSEILRWGVDLDDKAVRNQVGDLHRWQNAAEELLRMVLDPGLLQAWPGKPSAWAPVYALQLLGRLQVTRLASQLIALADDPNDWLSHRLPETWAGMGDVVEGELWPLLGDLSLSRSCRLVILAGTRAIYLRYPARRFSIAQRWLDLLRNASLQDIEFNAYLAFVLDDLQIAQVQKAIADAIEAGKVDKTIFGFEDDA